MNDKKHWYDGHFYDKMIAPNQDKMFKQIINLIPEGSSVLDVGCGTGRLAFQLSDKCKNVVGLDLSSKNIAVANANLKLTPKNNIEFIHCDIEEIKKNNNTEFDFAVITYVIHEMKAEERAKVLSETRSVAKKIIIGDYISPTPNNLWGKTNVVIEFIAGKGHYNNFKSYVKNGGINYIVKESNLKKLTEIKNQPQTSHLVVIE